MKKILILIVGIFLVSLVSASIEDLGSFEQNECIDLPQTCADCTYNNISSILFPDSTRALGQVVMTKTDTFYNYTFCATGVLGTYKVNGYGDAGGVKTTWNYYFKVTPSGETDNLGFIIILIVLTYGVGFFGFFGRNRWVSILGGFGMLALGIYFIAGGIVIYRDWFTNAISYITIGLGAIFSSIPIIEYIQEVM